MTGRGIDPASFAARLVRWQRDQGRHDLPWQQGRDPYRVWVSEIMLQQTRVDTVLRYYPRFLQRFPDVRALAAAALDEVLEQWSGLGYYRRARNLHACARQVCLLHGGHFPRTRQELEALAGIGRSTAAAIAVFCFEQREAILDANVQRVLGRAFGLRPGSDAASRKAMWDCAESLLPRQDLPAYTQGLMDLGATVCKPTRPDCLLCPFAADCPRELDPVRAARAPAPAARRSLPWVLLWARDPARPAIWLQRRDAHGIWPGLWCLPQHDDESRALAQARALGGVLHCVRHDPVLHRLTHVDLLLHPMEVVLRPHALAADAGDGAGWFDPARALRLGLPAPVRKLLQRA